MLRFKNYLSEEVLPTAGVKNGVIDIENTAVRGQINATLANVTAQPAVTPYIVLHRISKALSYFHIIMPKRAYLEGDKGVEVVEVKQFGHRMGMTNDGQFIHDVPSKYFLFISYRLASSMGADYAAVGNALSSVGGMFKVTAKLVDEAELQSLLSMAEISLAEDCDAEKQQLKAKAMAPKEGMHTALGDCDCSQGDSPSTKSAVDTSMRRKDKKLSAAELEEGRMPASVIKHKQKLSSMSDEEFSKKYGHKSEKELRDMASRHGYGFDKATKTGSSHYVDRTQLKYKDKPLQKEETQVDEASYEKLDKYVRKAHVSGTGAAARGEIAMHRGQKTRLHRANKTGEKREQGINLALDKMAGRALVPAKRKEKMEEEYGVFRNGGSIGEKPSTEPHKKFDSAEEAKAHAKGMNKQLSRGEKKYYRIKYHVKPIKEEQIDEVSLATAAKTARQRNIGAERSAHASPYDYSPHIDVQKRKAGKTVDRIARKYGDDKAKKVSDKMEKDTDKVWRGKMDEKLTKAMSAGDVISDFIHSKDPKFKGKSKKMRQKMALGAYYGMHPEKSKLDEMMSRLKKTTAHRKMAVNVDTKTRHALGAKKEDTKTILVTKKGDPRAAAGGGVQRIPKEKFDPSIYNRASE